MSENQRITIQKSIDGVATVTLNRPHVHNAFDEQMIQDMINAFSELRIDPAIKILCLKSNGKHFSAGADLDWMRKMAQFDEVENIKDAKALGQLMYQLYHFPKPTLAIVQGNAYGGGVGLIACCKIAIVAEQAQFCFTEAKLGLIPAVISPYIIQAIGQRNARAYFLNAQTFNAIDALRMGLCQRVVAQSDLDAAGNEMIASLLHNGPQALVAINQLIDQFPTMLIDQARVDMTVKVIAKLRVSSEGQEGLNAFLEKREPSWVKTN